MNETQRQQWKAIAERLRSASATVEALACGYVDNHGKSMGNEAAAAVRVIESLSWAMDDAKEMVKP